MPADHRRLKDLLDSALDISGSADRDAFLNRECGGDRELRQELDALLAARDRPASALEGRLDASPNVPIATAGLTTTGSQPGESDAGGTATFHHAPIAPTSLIGGTIAGRYRLCEEIGEGGMGSVYLAEQIQPVKRQVALKVIKPGMDSKTVLARFESERQALALMDHPHIAKVFDAGTTERGQPFFVMELVKGISLTEYCDQYRLGLAQRLELFRQICSAVQHAHQKGIIHRDLKPTNILVESHDGAPVPKVIDFGLAKATGGLRLTENSMYSAFGTVAGTPLYMAPEQASFGALDIDTRADIYALGVILYELLTGSTPIRREAFRQAAFDEMLRLIREVEPPTPSSRISTSDTLPSIAATRQTEPARLSRFLRGDLDWIVMKALAKERDRRYESAIALAQDIERFTKHEPVTAGPPTAAYRVRKFARRHRMALATGGGVALLLVAATAVSSGLAVWALSAERSAKEQQGRAQNREEMAIVAVKRYSDVVREMPDLKNNPALATLRTTLLKEPQRFFKSLSERLQADRDTTPESLRRLAAASFDLGFITAEIGDKQDAVRDYQEALAIWERLARQNPSVTDFQSDVAVTGEHIGAIQSEMGRPAQALEWYERARAIFEQLTRENPTVTLFQSELAISHNNIGLLQSETRQPAKAMASYEQAFAISERLALASPSVTDFQSDLAASHNNIGNLHNVSGRATEALASYEQARAILERLAREHPESPDFASNVGANLNNTATIEMNQGRFDLARAKLTQAIQWQRKALSANLSHPTYRQFLANHLTNLIRAADGLGRADEADRARRELAELAAGDPAKAALDARLAVVLKGQSSKDNAERIGLANRAYEKALHAASARLFAEVLGNDPELADDRRAQHRYNAACAAALAGAGQGKDDPSPDPAARAKLRMQARAWLEAELAAWDKVAGAGAAEQKAGIAPTLEHWKTDPDLAGIRDEKELAKLPESERAALRQLWNDLDQLLKRAAFGGNEGKAKAGIRVNIEEPERRAVSNP